MPSAANADFEPQCSWDAGPIAAQALSTSPVLRAPTQASTALVGSTSDPDPLSVENDVDVDDAAVSSG